MTATSADLDEDLAALAEARSKARAARAAHLEFEDATQADLDRIVAAMASAALDVSAELARMAVDETGYGVYEDKILRTGTTPILSATSMPGPADQGGALGRRARADDRDRQPQWE